MPFARFPGVDPILGPEMRSTGEVMGLDATFGRAFAKSQIGAGLKLPLSGSVFISVRDADKAHAIAPARQMIALGFDIVATRGTADALEAAGVPVKRINKVLEGRPHVVDAMKNGEIHLVFQHDGRIPGAGGFDVDPAHRADAESALLYDHGRGRRGRGSHRLAAAWRAGRAAAAKLCLSRRLCAGLELALFRSYTLWVGAPVWDEITKA